MIGEVLNNDQRLKLKHYFQSRTFAVKMKISIRTKNGSKIKHTSKRHYWQ